MQLNDLTQSLLGGKPRGRDDDLGFGSKINVQGKRLINRDGSFNIKRSGIRNWTPYLWLVEMHWLPFFLLIFLFYLLMNAAFALAFLAIGVEQLAGVQPGTAWQDFWQAFYFSVQTFTTVGYGAVHPLSAGANMVASLDAMVGLMAFALATGLFFARFAKPRAQILFSEHAIVAPYRGGKSLQFRIANRRNNKIIDLVAEVAMTWIEKNPEGAAVRRFSVMPLERNTVSLFPLNWTIVHPINEESPLFGKDPESLKAMAAEILILIEGFDETYAMPVHTSSSYTWHELQWDRAFVPMYFQEDGFTVLKLDRISETFATEEGGK